MNYKNKRWILIAVMLLSLASPTVFAAQSQVAPVFAPETVPQNAKPAADVAALKVLAQSGSNSSRVQSISSEE